MEIDNRHPDIRPQRRPKPPQRRQVQPQRYKQPQRIDPAKYQKPILPQRLEPTQYQIQRPQVKYRRRLRNKFSRLKYGNLLSLFIGAIAIGWLVTLPFRLRRSPDPPIIATQEVIAPPAIAEISENVPPQEDGTFTYNIKTPPNPIYSQQLQLIVDEAVNIAAGKQLPVEPLSITLIDVSNPQKHTFAGYQNQKLRFPASVAKLFWMAAFYSALEKGKIEKKESAFTSDLEQMIRISNNDAASRLLDEITDTKSGGRLAGKELETWLEKRRQINDFFLAAGYTNISLSTKNYPIYYLRQEQPAGRDLQLRGEPSQPIRNQVTTDQAARLIYEIYTRQSVSSTASRKMAYLLTRDLDPKAWKNDPTNPIKGFLGESLPVNIYFGSKVGFTSKSRTEAAFIRTLDDRAIYILVVFADDPAYARDETIFPAISRYVFDRLNSHVPN